MATQALLDLGALSLPLTAEALFGHSRPLEVELGSGKGRFLVEWAVAHPERGFLGVERCSKYARLTASRAAKRQLENLRVVRTTAEDLLFRCLARSSVATIHVYFSDPWPKLRHAKRRLFTRGNLDRMVEVLQPGGSLLVKTDHGEYAGRIAELLGGHSGLVVLPATDFPAEIPLTSYEAKYGREGREIFRFACRQRSQVGPS